MREVGGGELGSSEGMVEDKVKLSMMCWNVCGWCEEEHGMEQIREDHDMGAKVIDFYKPDVMALVETWLKGEEEMRICGRL